MCEREKVRVCAVESERERRRHFSIITVSSISWGPTFIGLSLWPDLICRCSLGRRMDRVWGLLRSHLKAEVFIETFGQAIAVCLVGPVSQRDTHTAFSRNSRPVGGSSGRSATKTMPRFANCEDPMYFVNKYSIC